MSFVMKLFQNVYKLRLTFVPSNYEELYSIFFDQSFSAIRSGKQDQCQNFKK